MHACMLHLFVSSRFSKWNAFTTCPPVHVDYSEEEPAQGPDAAAAVPEADEAPGGGRAVHPAGPHRPQGGGPGAAHAGAHRTAAALVRGEDEPGQGRSRRKDAARRVPAFLPCALTTVSCTQAFCSFSPTFAPLLTTTTSVICSRSDQK
jgi:hypothetical protein